MKFTTVATLAALGAGAEAARRGPRSQFVTCQVSGDPHYTPFTGRANKFTMMGDGEYVLAKDGDFQVNGCQQDMSWKTRSFKKTDGAITWNKEVVAVEGEKKVEVLMEPTLQVIVNGKEKTSLDVTSNWRKSPVSISEPGLRVRQYRRNQLYIKFTETGRMITVSYMHKTKGRFGDRKAFNVVIKAPRTADSGAYSGLCAEKKSTKANWAQSKAAASLFTASTKCTPTPTAVSIKEEDKVVVEAIREQPCAALVRAAALRCQATGAADQDGCIFDITAGCTAADDQLLVAPEPAPPTATAEAKKAVEDKQKAVDAFKLVLKETVDEFVEQAETTKDYSCPANAYVNTQSWPLAGFEDCKCMWGFTAVENAAGDDHTCVASAAPAVRKPWDKSTRDGPDANQCFCDATSAFHCSHTADKSCGLPLKIGGGASDRCDDPVEAMDNTKCVCGEGTMDCRSTKYDLVAIRQPGLAVPNQPFGQQPIFALRNNGKTETADEKTVVRISIANAQSSECGCSGGEPCKHNGVGDNTCFPKQELFGEQVCPAGTTECLREQVDARLFRKDLNDDEVERKDKECQNGSNPTKSKTFPENQPTKTTTLCSDETPCKHQGDGTCTPMVTFQPLQEQIVVPKKLRWRGAMKSDGAAADWRLAEPTATPGWFFGTDASCDMTDASKGCSEDGHSYAMDKWCDHNCNPKFTGQPPFCPKSHCVEDTSVAKAVPMKNGWRCPLDRYHDGTCRCAAGTERCGSIEVKAYKGVFNFEHLTIGKPGKYQLLVEVVMPDQNTGSNNIQISALSSVFEVRYPSVNKGECRAQKQWRIPDLPDSEVQGAGKAWFYEDTSIRCTAKNADGTCKETKQVFAMDKWCKANRCLAHTLLNHCEIAAPTLLRKTPSCVITDAFGECCPSGVVDQCNVCDGDGSTCKVETYLSTFVPDSATSDNVFDAKHAGHDCPSHSPCAHLNDKSCVPKTYNSANLVNDDFVYCYKNMVGDNSHWKKGEWDDPNGQLSIKVLHPTNTDCFCPVGTVDVTDRAIVAEDAEKQFFDSYKKKIEDTKAQIAEDVVDAKMAVEMEAKDIMIRNTEGEVELISAPCDDKHHGLKISLVGGKFRPTTGLRMENGSSKKASDKIRCIRVPPLVSVKTWKHGCKTQKGQVRYTTIVNTKTTAQYFDVAPSEQTFGAIETVGNVLKPEVAIVGTEADAAEMSCSGSAESRRCAGNSECRKSMTAVKECTKTQGTGTFSCMTKHAYSGAEDLTRAWAGLAVCMAKQLRSQDLFSIFSKGLFREKERRLASGVTAAVRVTTGGNNGLIGTPSSSASAQVPPASTAIGKYASTAPGGSAASNAGMGAGMIAIIALVSVGAAVGAAVSLKKRHGSAVPTPFTPSASKELASTNSGAAKEDCTDVL